MKIAAFYENICDGVQAAGLSMEDTLSALRDEGMERLYISVESWKRDGKTLQGILRRQRIPLEGMHGFCDFPGNPDSGEYRDMIAKIKKSSPATNPEDLQYILDRVDVENYFEYLALEMFVGNSDIGNLRCYRTSEPGAKWKWIWYDADYGLFNSGFDSPKSYTKTKGMGDQKIDNTIFLKLLTVPEYKDMFLRKLGEIFQTFTTEYMLEILEPLVDQITPEMTLHWARWGEENDQYVISEVPVTSDGAYRYWEKRVNRLRNVVKKRPNLLWGFVQDSFSLSNAQMVEYFGERPEMPDDVI